MAHSTLQVQGRVIGALMLRDIKTRFGGNPANYVIAIGWPTAHIAVLLIIYSAAGRLAPYGSSATQFFATGVIPFITFNYCARFSMFSLMINGPLMGFPIVKMLDIILARILLELISSISVIIIVALGLAALGIEVIPREPDVAVEAVAATLLFAAGMGLTNSLIVKKIPPYVIGYILIQILLYMTAGIIFLPEAFPQYVVDTLSWNPLLHAVAWFRSAYYPGYGESYLSKSYLLLSGTVLITVGLIVERFGRRWLLATS